MAKAKVETVETTEKPKFSFGKGGQGKKQCPGCDAFVGARIVGKCPNPDCSHVFEVKEKADKPAKTGSVVITGEAVALFVLWIGDPDKAISALHKVKSDPILDFVGRAGGVEPALKLVHSLKDKLSASPF